MLLTLNPSSQNGIQRSHEHSRFRKLRSPSPSIAAPDPPALAPAPAAPSRPADPSSMDFSRNNLPRPSLTLPPPDVGFASIPSTAASANQQLPPPPSQWQSSSSDDAMHHWLQAKAEEDRRKQEEEKTRQETLRLEQRRVEASMLRDSLIAGVPPQIIPLVFAGICQNGLPQPVLELAQQYLSQAPATRGPNPQAPPPAPSHTHSVTSSHSRRPSMHVRQDSRTGLHHAVPPPPPPPPPNILLSQNAPPNITTPPTPQVPGRRSVPTGPSDTRAGTNPWVNHAGVQAQSSQINMGNVQYAPGSSLPVSQAPRRLDSQSRRSPPSLYFHHWVPPAQQQPGVTAGKAHGESPAHSNPRRSEHYASPGRKRKASGAHQPAPIPSAPPYESLTGIIQTSRAGSPKNVEQQMKQLGRSHRLSDTSAGHADYHLGKVKVEQFGTMSPSRVASALPGYTLAKGQASADRRRSRNSSPADGADKNLPRTLQDAYPSNVEYRRRDPDAEGSSHTFPTSEAPVASSQPRDAAGG
ncbi:uncharacterized protein DSM5745_03454 [Aspergillus mulundensis]|uniref:Uncharacterized protein n=1 Tax=Aspergillus mulundensis TaxID=1810919 RepID=A0A3D8SKN1_9EURO|nr:hypothetical protein DSM5745_03454 [Aspergillus mulundensis]RDW86812.1 hypothetical protein DSM5745_03454 [Aspergillus mulundensis]